MKAFDLIHHPLDPDDPATYLIPDATRRYIIENGLFEGLPKDVKVR